MCSSPFMNLIEFPPLQASVIIPQERPQHPIPKSVKSLKNTKVYSLTRRLPIDPKVQLDIITYKTPTSPRSHSEGLLQWIDTTSKYCPILESMFLELCVWKGPHRAVSSTGCRYRRTINFADLEIRSTLSTPPSPLLGLGTATIGLLLFYSPTGTEYDGPRSSSVAPHPVEARC